MKVAPSVSDQFGPTCRPEDYKRPLLHSLLGRHSRRRQMSRLSVSPPSPAPKAPRPHLAFSGSSAWRAPRLNPFSHSSSRPWPPLACCNPQQKPPPHHHCHANLKIHHSLSLNFYASGLILISITDLTTTTKAASRALKGDLLQKPLEQSLVCVSSPGQRQALECERKKWAFATGSWFPLPPHPPALLPPPNLRLWQAGGKPFGQHLMSVLREYA